MTDISTDKQVFFHVGLGKTGTTYLQYEFFPKLRGIHYIQRTHYQHAPKLIALSAQQRHLVSREFDQQLEDEITRFAKYFPAAGVIVVLRRHDSWIASQYRRFAKNGIHVDFQDFFDIEGNKGLWKYDDLNYMAKLQLIESTFERPPLVLFQEELKQDPRRFFGRIAAYTGTSYDPASISLEAVHRSYSDKQLKAVRRFSRYLFPAQETRSRKTLLGWLQWRRIQLTSYAIMYPARWLPESWFSDVELIPQSQLERIREHFAEDWQQCQAYAKGQL